MSASFNHSFFHLREVVPKSIESSVVGINPWVKSKYEVPEVLSSGLIDIACVEFANCAVIWTSLLVDQLSSKVKIVSDVPEAASPPPECV